MNRIKTGWNDATGARIISDLTCMIENMGIIDDRTELHTFGALSGFWNLTYTCVKDKE